MKIADLTFTSLPSKGAPARSTCGRYLLHYNPDKVMAHTLSDKNLTEILDRAPWDAVISFTFPDSFAS